MLEAKVTLYDVRGSRSQLIHSADHLMAGNQREFGKVQLSLDGMQIRPAYAAGVDP